jgi:hypothetical protein
MGIDSEMRRDETSQRGVREEPWILGLAGDFLGGGKLELGFSGPQRVIRAARRSRCGSSRSWREEAQEKEGEPSAGE